jgi:hypothetical protein
LGKFDAPLNPPEGDLGIILVKNTSIYYPYGGLKTDTSKYVIELARKQRRNLTEAEQLKSPFGVFRGIPNIPERP